MKHQITKVVVNSIEAPLIKQHDIEFPSLAAATAFIRTYKPKTVQECYVKVNVTIHWDDGTFVGARFDMTSHIDSLCNPRWAIYNKMAFFAGIYQPSHMTDDVYRINQEMNAKDGDVNALNLDCLKWLLEYDLELPFGHELSAEELADISDEWENPTVDTRKYYQSVMQAWEVIPIIYHKYKQAGGLCQQHNGKFYIA